VGARAKLVEVLTFLRNLPKPYVMLYDLHGVDERLRTKRRAASGRRLHRVLSPDVDRA
jgi:NADH-quinone oxidoreductase subunit C/D